MIAAVIPTRYRPPELGALLRVLAGDGVEALVLASGDYGHAVYRMWNAGAEMARALGASHTAVLNDDAALPPGALPAMAQALDVHPEAGVVYPDVNAAWDEWVPLRLEPTEGSWGPGGMTGFAFMFRTADPLPAFDEGYGWWYGDDAFEEAVRASGRQVCRLVGVPVRHAPNGSASRDWGRLAGVVAADRARWEGRTA